MMHNEQVLLREESGGVVTLTLNRPAQFNALFEELLDAGVGVTVDHRMHGTVDIQQHAVVAAPVGRRSIRRETGGQKASGKSRKTPCKRRARCLNQI